MPRISIVTVAFNEQNRIEKTVKSVLSQDFYDFEYIVVDGASEDRTVEIVEQYRNDFDRRKIFLGVYSEPDTGVYNAMNKSLKYIKGEYVIFLNAGDTFVAADVLSKISPFLNGENDVVYGHTMEIMEDWHRLMSAKEINEIVNGMPFCHQSAFTKAETLNNYVFDEKYKICADYDSFAKMYSSGCTFMRMDIIVSYFLEGGLCASDLGKSLDLEAIEVRKNNMFIDGIAAKRAVKKANCKYEMRKIKRFIRKLIPQVVKERLLDRRYRRLGWEK